MSRLLTESNIYTWKNAFSFLFFVFTVIVSIPASAEKASVAVAANFTAPARDLAQAFTHSTGHEVVLSFGSTGKLFAQITHGAPFDVFLAADRERPKRAEQEGLMVQGSRFTYAQGKIVLWSRDKNALNPKGTPLDLRVIIESDAITRLAIANPKIAPYGRAAMETLTRLGVYENVKGKIVQGENIAQTYQFAYTGNAELAIISMSQITLNESGSHWIVPSDFYTPLDQQAVLLNRGADNKAANAFVDFLKSNEAAVIIEKFGYTIKQNQNVTPL